MVSVLDLPGHRSELRTVALSHGSDMILTCSAEQLKLWNVSTMHPIRSFSIGSPCLCAVFLPGDQYILIGSKSGQLTCFAVASGEIIFDQKAHDGSLWSIALDPTCISNNSVPVQLVTGSVDKMVHFWKLDMASPSLSLDRSLQVPDGALCLRFSPNGKLLAVSLLDSTIRVFYADTLKFFLSLYGHKLPVLSLDISSDNTLLLSGSSDKNVKLWGLDFGDCHKSIFAHDEAITCVSFVPNTHLFFTGSKDKSIKYWDGDAFVQISKLPYHGGDVLGLCLSRSGSHLVSVGSDRALRVWTRTKEQVFIEEERERELEELMDNALLEENVKNKGVSEEGAGELGDALPGQQSLVSMKATERLHEVITLALEELALTTSRQDTPSEKVVDPSMSRHPLLVAYARGDSTLSVEVILWSVLESIPSGDLEQALLLLPLSSILGLFQFMPTWMETPLTTLTLSRILNFLLKVHGPQLKHSKQVKSILEGLKGRLKAILASQRDVIGYNVAVLKYLEGEYLLRHTSEFAEDALTWRAKVSDVKRKYLTAK